MFVENANNPESLVFIKNIFFDRNDDSENINFSVDMPDDAKGEHVLQVKFDDSDTIYEERFIYNAPQVTITQTGNTIAVSGKTYNTTSSSVNIKVLNSAGNIIYVKNAQADSNRNYNFNFIMPDGSTSGTYSVVISEANTKRKQTKTFNYNYTEQINLSVNSTYNKVNFIVNSTTLAAGTSGTAYVLDLAGNQIKSIPLTLDSNKSYSGTIDMSDAENGAYVLKVVVAGTHVRTKSFVVTTKASKNITIKSDKNYYISLTFTNLKGNINHSFELTYNPQDLILVDLFAQTYTEQLQPAAINYRDFVIEVTNVSNGRIEFNVRRLGIGSGKTWSGTLNVFKFKANKTGTTNVIAKIL